MNHVVEYIGKEGVRHTPLNRERWERPSPGDAVLLPDGSFGMIEGRGRGLAPEDCFHVCEKPEGVFLGLKKTTMLGLKGVTPYVDISGGPFRHVHPSCLQPTHALHTAQFWNWGNNGAGVGHGVRYLITRPVFKLLAPEKEGA